MNTFQATTPRGIRSLVIATVLALPALSAHAQITQTELAGNALSAYPFFEYVRAFNVDAPVTVAIDPTRFPGISGQTCDIYVVQAKSADQWSADPSLTDVTGGAQTESFGGTTIQANTFPVTGPAELNADAGTDLGVGYDVVLDCDRDGQLNDGDFIDGMGNEAGFFAVHDTTAAGPLAVIELQYSLDPAVGASFGIPADKLAQDLYYPADVASMGRLPLVAIGHGNGHSYDWYDHIGFHLASYGYIVISLDNDTGPGVEAAATTILGHTDAFIDQAEAGAIAGGTLTGHIDTDRITWIGHSRGAEGVVIGYDRLFDGSHTPAHFVRENIRLISSMLPTDFRGTDIANPHDANYHLWTASGDDDVNGAAWCTQCQTFSIHDRATGYRQSTVVQGTGHGWFHDGPAGDDADDTNDWFTGPCSIGPDDELTHKIQLGHFLPLIKHYIEGNIPALDFLTRQYESFRPIGVPDGNPCIVVSHEYRNGATIGNFVIDDYQSGLGTNISSSFGSVSIDVENIVEGRLDDANGDFAWDPADPFNGATQAQDTDASRGVVFDWTDADRFYEWEVVPGQRDFASYRYLSMRGAQGTRHPNTLAASGDLTFSVTLRDAGGTTSTINIGAYGGGLEQPYARDGGWHNEMETIRIRTTDFLNNGSGLNLNSIVAVRLDVGPSWGSARGRIVVDDLMLTNDQPVTLPGLEIIDPTQDRPARGGSPTQGSRVLVRLRATEGLDLSLPNLNVVVDGTGLAVAQILIYSVIEDETWLVIVPGPKPVGCYDLEVNLVDNPALADMAPQSLCYDDIETVVVDRVVAVDRTNSMRYDSATGVASEEKMVAAQDAASHFVGLSNAQDGIGVVSFQLDDANGNHAIEDGELARLEQPLIVAESGGTDHRPAVRVVAESITPSPGDSSFPLETSIGAAILASKAELDAHGQTDSERVIVLVTDGRENYPPYWTREGGSGPLKPDIVASGVTVHTVAIGQDAEYEVLADIADSTGGLRYSQFEGNTSYSLLSRLTTVFKSIDEDIHGEQRFYYREGVPSDLPRGEEFTREGRFQVEPFLDWMTVSFHWAPKPSKYGVTLYQPDGTEVTPLSPSDDKHTIFRVIRPQAGEWTYRVPSSILPTGEFTAIASGPTSLTARSRVGDTVKTSGTAWTTPLRVWIAEHVAVAAADVIATIVRPDRTKATVVLRDDGSSADGAAADGVYGFVAEETILGAYHVDIVAQGEFGDAQPFERYLSASFAIPGRPAPSQPPYGEGRPGGGLCGGQAWCCWLWAAFLLVYMAALLALLRLICFYRDGRVSASSN